jgi:hypothetical protein
MPRRLVFPKRLVDLASGLLGEFSLSHLSLRPGRFVSTLASTVESLAWGCRAQRQRLSLFPRMVELDWGYATDGGEHVGVFFRSEPRAAELWRLADTRAAGSASGF